MNADEGRRLALTIAYDGTDYAGWQRQTNALSIQEVIEEAVERLFHETVHLVASGRTDAGVHAEGQVAAMTLRHPIAPEKLQLALNAELPASIRIMKVTRAANDFQPRYDAKEKTYRYTLYTGQTLPPKYRFTAVHERRSIDWDKVQQVLSLYEGEHDFAAFHSTGSHEGSTVRTIYKARLYRGADDENQVHIEVTGNGFLYNMVRILVGTALEVGCGKRPLSDIESAFQSGERRFCGATAPAKGLTLVGVIYPDDRQKTR